MNKKIHRVNCMSTKITVVCFKELNIRKLADQFLKQDKCECEGQLQRKDPTLKIVDAPAQE